MTTLLLETALLPDGWAQNVALTVSDGVITGIATGSRPGVGERLAGIVVPGLPNLHSHTFQRGMAGLAELRGPSHDDFWTWREVMYRFVDAITPDDLESIASFAMMEMLEAGFTALGEFHYLHHAPGGAPYADVAELGARIVTAAEATGIGLTLLPVLYARGGFDDRPLAGGQLRFGTDLDGYFSVIEGSRAAVSRLDDARVGIAPHSLRAVGPRTLQGLLQAYLDGPIHMHLAEQVKEVEESVAWSGQRPAAWLLSHAAVDARWCLVHATHLDATETVGIARSGAVVSLCPLTEANLGDGIFDGPPYLAAGGHWGVGTDSNIEVTAPGELKQFEYSQRLAQRRRNVLTRTKDQSTGRVLYEEALAGGRRALARDIGAIALGYRADLVVLDASLPGFAAAGPEHWLDVYIFALGRSAIKDVYVGGRCVVANKIHHEHEAIASRYTRTMRRLATY